MNPVVLAFVAVVMLAVPAFGHGGEEGAVESIIVEPSSVSVGGTVLLVGSDLEPDTPRILLLKGEDVIVELGSVTTSAEGRFKREITIPAHLPAGVYQLEAIGDETLRAEVQVVGSSASGASPAGLHEVGDSGPRSRPGVELALILLLAGLVAAIGVVLVARAERIGASSG